MKEIEMLRKNEEWGIETRRHDSKKYERVMEHGTAVNVYVRFA